jgi:hypothetical protein
VYTGVGPFNASTDDTFNHAVVLVGYNNDAQHWILLNSWGTDWGDYGFARVTYDQLDLANVDDTWGIMFYPSSAPALPPTTPDASLRPGCAYYQARHLSVSC